MNTKLRGGHLRAFEACLITFGVTFDDFYIDHKHNFFNKQVWSCGGAIKTTKWSSNWSNINSFLTNIGKIKKIVVLLQHDLSFIIQQFTYTLSISIIKNIDQRVSQGSILGPLLSIICANVTVFIKLIVCYADDTNVIT